MNLQTYGVPPIECLDDITISGAVREKIENEGFYMDYDACNKTKKILKEQDKIFFEIWIYYFWDKSIDLSKDPLTVRIPSNWEDRIQSEDKEFVEKSGWVISVKSGYTAPMRGKLTKYALKKGKKVEPTKKKIEKPQSHISQNPYYGFFKETLKDYDIEYNGYENPETLIIEIKALSQEILENEKYSQDIQLVNNEKFEKVSDDFRELFIELSLLQIYTWEEGTKKDKKNVAKINKHIWWGLQEYFNYVGQDFKKNGKIKSTVDDIILKTLLQDENNTWT